MSMIRITVSGRAATDPTTKEVRGSSCVSFGVIGDTGTKDDQGNKESIFFWVTIWGKRGETVAKYLKKGERVLVMGNFTQRLYKAPDAEAKIQNQITAQDVDLLGGGLPKDQAPAGQAAAPAASPDDDDELPFY